RIRVLLHRVLRRAPVLGRRFAPSRGVPRDDHRSLPCRTRRGIYVCASIVTDIAAPAHATRNASILQQNGCRLPTISEERLFQADSLTNIAHRKCAVTGGDNGRKNTTSAAEA